MKNLELIERVIKKLGEDYDWRPNSVYFSLKDNANIELLRALSRVGKVSLLDYDTLEQEVLEHQVNNFEIEVAHPHYCSTDMWCGPRCQEDYEIVDFDEIKNLYFNRVFFEI